MGILKQRMHSISILKILKCLSTNIMDEEFRKWMFAYKHSPNIIKIEHLGTQNMDKIIYHICFDSEVNGFFAMWRYSLHCLEFSEFYGFVPVVEWGSKTVYYEPAGIDGIMNAFEYYFAPISDIDIDEIKNSAKIVNAHPGRDYTPTMPLPNYTSNTELIEKYVYLCRKYLRIRPYILDRINIDIQNLLLGKKTLAVHVRGVEWGNIKGHPQKPNLQKYINDINNAIQKYHFTQIFLATDSNDTIEYFRKSFNIPVIYYGDVARAQNGSNILAIYDKSTKRNQNAFLLGYEVLRDMFTMVACNSIIAGTSNISVAVLVYKELNCERFEYIKIYDTEVVHRGISPSKAIKKMRKQVYHSNYKGK